MISFVRSLAPNFPPKRTRRDDTHTPAAALMVAYIILLSVSPPPIYLRVVAVSACVAGVRACLSLGFFPMPVRITWPVRQSVSRSQVYSQVSTATGKIRLLLSERTHTASQPATTDHHDNGGDYEADNCDDGDTSTALFHLSPKMPHHHCHPHLAINPRDCCECLVDIHVSRCIVCRIDRKT